jgi:sugar lactone lactonase YvrE
VQCNSFSLRRHWFRLFLLFGIIVLQSIYHANAACDAPPAGLVAWWQAEGNAYDSTGNNNGSLQGGLGFAVGEVGQAFNFNSTNADVFVPADSQLDVGNGAGFTLEAWINPTDVTLMHPIFEWNNLTIWGVHFHIAPGQPFNVNPGPGELYANIVDSSGGWHQMSSSMGVVTTNVFQHVALTYDKASGVATIYCNGQIVSQQTVGSFTPLTSRDLYLGRRPPTTDDPGDLGAFAGLIDEPTIYNRALSSNEIAAIYNAGSAGKCFTPVPPSIVSQPASQSVPLGGSVTFAVAIAGTAPMSYQWQFGGTNILNATNTTLTLTNVQVALAGNYSAVVTNIAGSTNSSNAVLTVNVPVCDTPPSGLVAWWQAEGNANDSIGNNNGTLMNGTGYTNGEVGTAFNLKGVNNFVLANPSTPSSLDVGKGSGFTIEGWINPKTISGGNMSIIEYERILGSGSGSDVGVQMSMSNPSFGGPGGMVANILDTVGGSHVISTAGAVLTNGGWQHIALSYDKASGNAALYEDGLAVAQVNLGSFTSQTSFTNFLIGARTYLHSAASPSDVFSGGIDEFSLYSRALSGSEIKAIFTNGAAGKFDTNQFSASPAQSLAEAGVAIPGISTNIFFGNNTNWQQQFVTFTAASATTPIVINGIEPGMLLDTFTVSGSGEKNLYYMPEESLASLAGISAAGEWQLEIQDDRVGDTNNATLDSWQLQFVLADTNALPTPPVFLNPNPPNVTMNEMTMVSVTNNATDANTNLTLTYSLITSPSWAHIIDANTGIITLTPGEADGPSTNTIFTVVTDSGSPPLSATNSFQLIVNEVNSPPQFVIPNPPTVTNNVGVAFVFTNAATDSDIPTNTLTYTLPNSPTGAIIDTNGVITWTPVLAQAGTTNIFTTVVTDFNPYDLANPHLSATNSFVVIVNSTAAVFTNALGLAAITTDGANLFVRAYDTNFINYILPIALPGTNNTFVYSNLPDASPVGLAWHGTNLFWIDPTNSPFSRTAIFRGDTNGGAIAPQYNTSTITNGSDIASDGSQLFMVDELGGSVSRLSYDFAVETAIGGSRYAGGFGSEHLNTLTVANGVVYVADSGNTAAPISPQVVSLSTNGGSYTSIYVGTPFITPNAITIGGSALFVVDAAATNTIWELPISGATNLTTLVSGPPFRNLQRITYLNHALYVTDNDTNNFNGTIFRVALPNPTASISGVSVTTNGVHFSWTAPIYDQFQVQSTTNITPPIVWGTFTNIITSTTGTFMFTDTNSLMTTEFYRLVELP